MWPMENKQCCTRSSEGAGAATDDDDDNDDYSQVAFSVKLTHTHTSKTVRHRKSTFQLEDRTVVDK